MPKPNDNNSHQGNSPQSNPPQNNSQQNNSPHSNSPQSNSPQKNVSQYDPSYNPKRQKPKKHFYQNKKQLFIGLLILLGIGLFIAVTVFAVLPMFSYQEPAVEAIVIPQPTPSPTPRPTPVPTPTLTPEPTPDPMEGMVHSPLTGLPIPEETAPLRPVAVVINNHSRALPQSGISEAEIIYEVLAEGNITRLVAIFHQLQSPRIGPVRSTRDYFVDFAIAYDSVFVHHGGSPSGYARLRNLNVDRLDGMALEGTVFWRDPERRKVPALIEHSSYTGMEQLETAMETRNIRRERLEDDNMGFAFNLDEVPFETIALASGGDFSPCLELTVPFSQGYPRRFVYDPETMTYAVYNVHGPHIDEDIEDEEEAQLHVTNILVQHTRMWLTGDAEGRREVVTIGSGTGYLAAEGGIVNVRWERDSHQTPTRWYFMNGEPITLIPGQTWINVLQDTIPIQVVTGLEPEEEAEEEDEYDEDN